MWRTTAKGKVDSLQSEIEQHESLLKQNISKCPSCGQDIKPASVRKMVKAYKARIEVPESRPVRLRRVFEIWVILTFAHYTDLLDIGSHRGEKEEALSKLGGEGRAKPEDLRESSDLS